MGDRLATIDVGQNVWGWCAPFSGVELGPHLTHVAWVEAYLRIKWYLDSSNHLATIHKRYRQTDRQRDRQDIQDNGPVA